ncbi:MAG TPA: ArnT family glycosyltransferase [Candidatus Brocadiaceae bacterium]
MDISTSLENRRVFFFDLLLLVIVSAFVLFPALGQNRDWASREIRHAEIIREMAESGNFLMPRLMGNVYCDKPPIMHIPAAILTRIMGKPSMFAARLPSAVAGVLGVLAIYGTGLLLFDRRTAILSALILIGMPGYSITARHARPDMILCLSVLFSSLFLGLGMKKQMPYSRMSYLLLAGLFAGLGVVTKGPYGILFPVFFAIFIPFRRQDFKRPRWGWLWFGLAVTIAVALWAIPAYVYNGSEYLWNVVFQPDLDVTKGDSEKSFFWYMLYGMLFTLPFSAFLPLALVDLRRRGYSAPLSIAGAIFTVISCVPKKRQHYLLPFYPFLALGIAASIIRHWTTNRLVRRAVKILIPLSIAGVPVFFMAIQPFVNPYKNSEMYFAEKIYEVVEPDARLYCVTGIEEVLAWVGHRYEGIYKVDRNDPSSGAVLRGADDKSYLVISEKNLGPFLKVVGPFPRELILSHKVGREKMMLFRLKEKVSDEQQWQK